MRTRAVDSGEDMKSRLGPGISGNDGRRKLEDGSIVIGISSLGCCAVQVAGLIPRQRAGGKGAVGTSREAVEKGLDPGTAIELARRKLKDGPAIVGTGSKTGAAEIAVPDGGAV